MAKANPERNYVGIEVHVPGIAQCVYEAGMAELKIYEYSMLTQFKYYVKCLTTVSTAYNFTSQTLGKKRHFKRRFVIHERMQLVEQKLELGGTFHAATDWEPYAEWMLDVLDNRPNLENLAGKGNSYPRPEWRPVTKFERRGIESGHKINDFIFKKIK